MKRLTLSKVARANLRVNRKAYISLFLGILTAVFLATATSLCAWGTVRGHEEQMAERVGWMDMYILGGNGGTDEQLRECPLLDLENPPAVYHLTLEGLERNADGLYGTDAVMERLYDAIGEFDRIMQEYAPDVWQQLELEVMR